jgi:hypothetical protein
MTTRRKFLSVVLSLIWFTCSSIGAEGQNSAKAYLTIVDGAACNEEGPAGIIKYLQNSNTTRSIVARVTIIEAPSEGKSATKHETYTVSPGDKVELGCSRIGGGAPIVEEISWYIVSAKYK